MKSDGESQAMPLLPTDIARIGETIMQAVSPNKNTSTIEVE